METPSSIRMATKSQNSITSQNGKKEDSMTKSRPNERSALLDITNDSPIVGLAMGSLSEKSPSSSAIKNRVRVKSTPGSGEALLRCQVKTLLQKVEEEAEFVHNNKISSADRPRFRVLLDLPGPSPVQILAPTPANTPQVPSLQETLIIAPIQVAEAVKPEEQQEECLVNRALLFDSPGKSEDSSTLSVVSSSLSYQGSEIRSYVEGSPEEDSSSAWSMQVNVSSTQEGEGEDDDGDEEEEEMEDFDEEEYEDCYDDESFDELCEGMSKMRVEDVGFEGKHTRFVYNSDGELEGEEVIREGSKIDVSPGVTLLKGLPVPEGKHLRFHDED